MGRTYQFECPRCEYRARVSGGRDSGLLVRVQTIQCTECKALYDAVIGIKVAKPSEETAAVAKEATSKPTSKPPRAPTFAEAVNRLPPRGLKKTEWKKFPPACPVSPLHKIKEWTQPGKCPRCGIYLDPSVLPFRLWD